MGIMVKVLAKCLHSGSSTLSGWFVHTNTDCLWCIVCLM